MAVEVAPTKVHLRGLDTLATENVKTYLGEHYPEQDIQRIEWIDDTSANIIYATPELATEALKRLLVDPSHAELSEQLPSSEAMPAKTLSTHPDVVLSVRSAFTTDVKAPRAHEASRFYLMNPHKDPREHKRSNGERRDRRRGHKRNRDEDNHVPFNINMYDDDYGTSFDRPDAQMPRRHSFTEDSRQIKRPRRGDLFADKFSGRTGDRLRNRSASPDDGDGRFGFKDNGSSSATNSRRDRSPSHNNAPRELLPAFQDKSKSRALGMDNADRELFPAAQRRGAPDGHDLFASKAGVLASHRRNDAFDAADETADLFAGNSTDSTIEGRLKSRSLAERITGSPINRRRGEGFSVKGAANLPEQSGISVKGAAQTMNPKVRELFPNHNGADNSRELFDQTRRAQRRKAEDLFS